MALKPKLANLDGVPADVAKEYKKLDDGTFVLDVESVDGFELANVSGLKSALEKERTNVTNLNTKLSTFKDIDPSAARDALKKVDEMKTWKPENEVEKRIELLKQEIGQAHGQEKATLEGKLKKAEAQLKKTLVTNVAVQAIQKAKGSVKLLLPHLESSIRMRETDNADNPYVVEVVNERGDVAVGDGNGNPMTIDQLVEKFRGSDDFAAAFQPSGTTGSGASNGGRTAAAGSSNGAKGGVIRSRDPKVLGASLDDIASGKVTVEMD